MKKIEKSEQNESSLFGKEIPAPGGLLANVSLLTTGGSSLQQPTNNDPQLLLTKNQTLQSIADTASKTNPKLKKSSDYVNTSTPARAPSSNIVYGFDLSPVHSYEMPRNALSKMSVRESKSENDISRYSLQSRSEEKFFSNNNQSAPNFMQAPSVTSSRQSRLSAQKSDNAETMMSQVYSQPDVEKLLKKHTTARKSTKSVKSPSYSPNRVSPRKSSKRYSHIKGSGYGINSSSLISTKSKLIEKPKHSKSSQKRSKSSSAEYLSDSALKLLAQVNESKDNLKFYSKFEKVPGNMSKVSTSYETKKRGNSAEAQRQSSIDLKNEENIDDCRVQRMEYQTLKERFNQLEEECEKLKEGNDEVSKENFLLSAKLNKLVTVNESVDTVIKDCVNEDQKNLEITKLKKEVFEQERLLTGYQQENEKLYQEVTKLRVQLRENESAMYKENLKFKSRIASLKEEVNEKNAVIRDKNQLLRDKENNQVVTNNAFTQTVEECLREAMAKSNKNEDKVLEDLQLKVENQQISVNEKDMKLKNANENVQQLEQQIQSLEMELDSKNRNWKGQDCKVEEELRRQVKELERCLVKAQGSDHVQGLLHGNEEKLLLEERCEQLEERLKIQEQQFSTNMQSLHHLYKNMSKDYEERVKSLSDQLELLKRHQTMKQGGNDCCKEHHQRIKEENEHYKLQLEHLNRELAEERKNNLNNKTYVKSRKKSHLNKNESSYHPHQFVQHPPVKAQSETLPQQTNYSTQIEELCIEKEGLLKQVVKWKDLYEEATKNHQNIVGLHDAQIEKLTLANKKVVSKLNCSISLQKENMMKIEQELTLSNQKLSLSQAREEALQLQVRNLLDELQDTRKLSPNATMRQLVLLQSQIRMLDLRQKSREEKLNNVVATSADKCLQEEIISLQKTIYDKDQIISRFQNELDAILRVLEALQKSQMQ